MQTEDAKVSTNISNELIDQLPLVVGGAMRSVFDLVSHGAGSEGQRHERGPRRRPGRRVRRHARRHLGEHQSQRRRRRDRVPDAFGRSDHRVLGRDQRLQARVRAGRRRRHHLRLEVGHERSSTARSTTSSATTRWTRKASSSRRRASIARTISAGRWAGRSRSRRLYDGKNKTFFFAAYEGFRNNQASNAHDAERADAGDVRRRFFELGRQPGPAAGDLRPGDHAAQPQRHRLHPRSLPGQHAFPPTGSAPSRRQYLALARSAVVPNRAGLVPGTLGYVSNNYPLSRRDDGGRRRTSSA